MQRRLAAILAADLVAYSRMIRKDEEGTLTRLRAAREDIIDPAIGRHRGRIVKLMGDGMLVEFSSAVDAVRAAVEVQRAMPAWNGDTPREEQMTFRIGINLGDVVVDGDDIQGDGVNVAARLESLAEPGTVCVTGSVHEEVRDRLGLPFRDLGPQQVKNIDRPVRAWQWREDAAVSAPLPEDVRPELPEGPSIAVLPFSNMSGDPEQDYFADGLCEDIITELSRNHEIFVISRNSSFSYRGLAMDVRRIGQELGVRYILEGSVRRGGDRLRLTTQLVEAETGKHVWAEKFDRPLSTMFEVQDEITESVVGAVGSEIWTAGLRGAARASDAAIGAWERLMKAWALIHRRRGDDILAGQRICRDEIARTGGEAGFHAALAAGCAQELVFVRGQRGAAEIIGEGMAAAHRAIERDPRSETAHAFLGLLLWVMGDGDGAIAEGEAALQINPNYVFAHLVIGAAEAYAGPDRFEAAMARLKHTIRLGPRDINMPWSYGHMATACFLAGRYDEAADCARTSVRLDPGNASVLRSLAAALALGGRIDEAKVAWVRATEVQDVSYDDILPLLDRLYRRQEDIDRYLDALRLAGAPFPASGKRATSTV
ncbi:MAG: hypothetical protein CML68_02865 [Rhodobacteraceae bacterium]|nr:hypothetical protein [Paracoccaceae bacterium]